VSGRGSSDDGDTSGGFAAPGDVVELQRPGQLASDATYETVSGERLATMFAAPREPAPVIWPGQVLLQKGRALYFLVKGSRYDVYVAGFRRSRGNTRFRRSRRFRRARRAFLAKVSA
jgi:hypothetical protein